MFAAGTVIVCIDATPREGFASSGLELGRLYRVESADEDDEGDEIVWICHYWQPGFAEADLEQCGEPVRPPEPYPYGSFKAARFEEAL